jgi:sugar phosphate isomerase/epimerase
VLTFPDLVLCEATIRPCRLEEFVDAAQASGCVAISVRAATALEAINRVGSEGVRRLLRDSGVQVADVDAMIGWLRTGADRWPAQVPESARLEPEQFLDLAATLGARAVNVVELSDFMTSADEIAERFASVCDKAADRGQIAYIEFFYGSAIKDLATAGEIVRRTGRRNAGVLHYYRGPSQAQGQLAANIELVRMLQVSDVPAERPADQWQERQGGRLLPGAGDIDLVGLLAAVRDAGADAPVGIEVSSGELRKLAPTEAAVLAANTTRSILRRLDVPDSPARRLYGRRG